MTQTLDLRTFNPSPGRSSPGPFLRFRSLFGSETDDGRRAVGGFFEAPEAYSLLEQLY